MKEFLLNAKEIMCLAANMGVSELYGISDGFADIPENLLHKEILHVRDTLESKKYLTEQFDGSVQIKKDVTEIVRICAFCQQFISVDSRYTNNPEDNRIYYIVGEKVVSAIPVNDSYKLQYSSVAEMTEFIRNVVRHKTNTNFDEFDFEIATKEFSRLKESIVASDVDMTAGILSEYTIPDVVATAITDALSGKADFHSFTFANVDKDNKELDNIMIINSTNGVLQISLELKEETDFMHFRNTNYDELFNELDLKTERLV